MRLMLCVVALCGVLQAQPQYDLRADGREFILAESKRASYLLLGELHGENEIPALIASLWPSLRAGGYRHVAAEVSPWVADKLFSNPTWRGPGLWRAEEAAGLPRLWGCDIEESDPGGWIHDLARQFPSNRPMRQLEERIRTGYNRSMAAELLAIARTTRHKDLIATLEVEASRANPVTRYDASVRREAYMKEKFTAYFRGAGARPGKVFARFGRNHLHRGLDRRGVSTLGNFLAEFAASRGESTFHLAAFGADGQIRLNGVLEDWDERPDDPAFAFLAAAAKYPETVFDLRPLRAELRRIPADKRTAAEVSLLYWADSYDAMICYRTVTPLPDGD